MPYYIVRGPVGAMNVKANSAGQALALAKQALEAQGYGATDMAQTGLDEGDNGGPGMPGYPEPIGPASNPAVGFTETRGVNTPTPPAYPPGSAVAPPGSAASTTAAKWQKWLNSEARTGGAFGGPKMRDVPLTQLFGDGGAQEIIAAWGAQGNAHTVGDLFGSNIPPDWFVNTLEGNASRANPNLDALAGIVRQATVSRKEFIRGEGGTGGTDSGTGSTDVPATGGSPGYIDPGGPTGGGTTTGTGGTAGVGGGGGAGGTGTGGTGVGGAGGGAIVTTGSTNITVNTGDQDAGAPPSVEQILSVYRALNASGQFTPDEMNEIADFLTQIASPDVGADGSPVMPPVPQSLIAKSLVMTPIMDDNGNVVGVSPQTNPLLAQMFDLYKNTQNNFAAASGNTTGFASAERQARIAASNGLSGYEGGMGSGDLAAQQRNLGLISASGGLRGGTQQDFSAQQLADQQQGIARGGLTPEQRLAEIAGGQQGSIFSSLSQLLSNPSALGTLEARGGGLDALLRAYGLTGGGTPMQPAPTQPAPQDPFAEQPWGMQGNTQPAATQTPWQPGPLDPSQQLLSRTLPQITESPFGSQMSTTGPASVGMAQPTPFAPQPQAQPAGAYGPWGTRPDAAPRANNLTDLTGLTDEDLQRLYGQNAASGITPSGVNKRAQAVTPWGTSVSRGSHARVA